MYSLKNWLELCVITFTWGSVRSSRSCDSDYEDFSIVFSGCNISSVSEYSYSSTNDSSDDFHYEFNEDVEFIVEFIQTGKFFGLGFLLFNVWRRSWVIIPFQSGFLTYFNVHNWIFR